METIDIGLTVLRIWVGVVIGMHGINHARSLDGTSSWFESIGFRRPRAQAVASAAVEVGAGAMLISGLGTSLASGAVAATMFVAFWTVHRANGFFIFNKGEGYEYVATLAAASLALAVTGPGSISIDDAIGLADRLDGGVGLLIVAASLALAVAQLTMFWTVEDVS